MANLQIPLSNALHAHVAAQAARLGAAPEEYIGYLIRVDKAQKAAEDALLVEYLGLCVEEMEKKGTRPYDMDDVVLRGKKRYAARRKSKRS